MVALVKKVLDPQRIDSLYIKSRGGNYAGSTNSHPRGVINKTRELTPSKASPSLITGCAAGFTEAADVIICWFW